MGASVVDRDVAGATQGEAASPAADYNFEHFRFRHVLADALGTITARGIRPGDRAPDFELPRTNGGSLRVSELHDRPVLLHFGSFT